jgi:hypothetical protein
MILISRKSGLIPVMDAVTAGKRIAGNDPLIGIFFKTLLSIRPIAGNSRLPVRVQPVRKG